MLRGLVGVTVIGGGIYSRGVGTSAKMGGKSLKNFFNISRNTEGDGTFGAVEVNSETEVL